MAVESQPLWGVGTAPTRAFLSLDGTQEHDPLTRAARDGWIELIAWSHAVVDSPRDAASGLVASEGHYDSGVRDSLVIVKPVDEASQRLSKALAAGELFERCVLEIWQATMRGAGRPRPTSAELLDTPREEALERYLEWLRRSRARTERNHVALLHNVRVRRIETEMFAPHPEAPYPEAPFQGPVERVSFTFERSSWTLEPVVVSVSGATPIDLKSLEPLKDPRGKTNRVRVQLVRGQDEPVSRQEVRLALSKHGSEDRISRTVKTNKHGFATVYLPPKWQGAQSEGVSIDLAEP